MESTDPNSNLATGVTQKQQQQPQQQQPNPTSTTASLVYLEDIHIFALANMLQRPIIVISLETIRNIQPIHLRGIYLPLFREPNECVKDPIVIGFHNYHFVPLVFALDSNTRAKDENRTIKYNEKYFHMDNVDCLDQAQLDDNAYEQCVKINDRAYQSSNNNNATNLSIRRKASHFYNVLPLVFSYDVKRRMKLHFVKESEQKEEAQTNLIKKYLNLVDVEVNANDIEGNRSVNPSSSVVVLCCFLDSCTEKPNRNGISMYIDYLNESMKVNSSSSSLVVTSPNVVAPSVNYSGEIRPSSTTPSKVSNRCKNQDCNREAMIDQVKFYGLCYECFKKQVILSLVFNDMNEIDRNKLFQSEHFTTFSVWSIF